MMSSNYYYTPLQKQGQKFFRKYLPLDELGEIVFTPDFSHIVESPVQGFPKTPTFEEILVGEALLTLTKTPLGRGVLVGAYALSYLPLLEPTKTSKTYGLSEMMYIQSGLGGAMRV